MRLGQACDLTAIHVSYHNSGRPKSPPIYWGISRARTGLKPFWRFLQSNTTYSVHTLPLKALQGGQNTVWNISKFVLVFGDVRGTTALLGITTDCSAVNPAPVHLFTPAQVVALSRTAKFRASAAWPRSYEFETRIEHGILGLHASSVLCLWHRVTWRSGALKTVYSPLAGTQPSGSIIIN
ncbi:predicted protein [Uncinocarpus reesii 1704]|uniref:Uncharacterized protein n=1 Tax=Uncinocarpus reesii (strain UAMH 1704) TaxID=336963 RepID=C4JPF6_UNCRE|nr:uncharacterized protein UREG_04538 [Uncinocarpus reesii 1704]EEP79692.1 predicted protein [Uncinocarpus reesii 1704]